MIELKNINVSFGKHHVLRNLNETFESGEVIGLVAPNGTGKSTLLNVMMNYLRIKSTLKGQDDLIKQLNLIFENNANFVEIKI